MDDTTLNGEIVRKENGWMDWARLKKIRMGLWTFVTQEPDIIGIACLRSRNILQIDLYLISNAFRTGLCPRSGKIELSATRVKSAPYHWPGRTYGDEVRSKGCTKH